MKKIFISIAVFISLLSCKKELSTENKTTTTVKQKKEPKVPLNFIKTYQGVINENKCTIKITSNNGLISGSYFYNKQCKEINLKGFLDSLGNIKINEFINNTIRYKFIGKMNTPQKIEGNYTNNKKNVQFSFIETSENYNTSLAHYRNKSFQNIVVDAVVLRKIPTNKSNGSSWDNMFGGYLPDIYLKIINQTTKEVYYLDDFLNRKENVSIKNTNVIFVPKKKIKLNKNVLKQGLIFVFIDFDGSTSDDIVGYLSLNEKQDVYIFDTLNKSKNIKNNDLQGVVNYHFE